jgi:hypothetical protein
MPAKTKRYKVLFFDTKFNTWRVLAPSLTSTDATKLMGMVMFDCRKEEVHDGIK